MKGDFAGKLSVLLAATMLTAIIGGCGKTSTETFVETGSTVTEQTTEESVALNFIAEKLARTAKRVEYLRSNGNSDLYSFDFIEKLEGNPLEGKTICVLGSSVADGYSSNHYAMGEFFEARFGCKLIKETESGTTLTNLYRNSYVSRMVNNIDAEEEIDLFICQLSTNDASNNLRLGEVSESTNLYDFNQWTIIGSMECIIGYAKETWNCPVVFFTGSYYDNESYEDMVNALSQLQKKWDIGVINLYHNDEFNNISDEMRSVYMSDDIHPNMAGYRDWWGPEMEKQLLEYLEKAETK